MSKLKTDKDRVYVRGAVLLGLIFVLFLALAGRLVDLQYFNHNAYAETASSYVDSSVTWNGRRGMIVDSRLRPMAVSLKVPSCALDPKLAKNSKTGLAGVIDSLRVSLQLSPAELDRIYRISSREGSRFVWIRRRIEDSQKKTLEELKLPGVYFPAEFERDYPQGSLASHVLGFSDIDGKGREGIENVCDSILRGLDGSRPVWRDALGNKLSDKEEHLKSLEPGLNVSLTIDSYIQSVAEAALKDSIDEYKAKSGCVVVMEPCSGDILAMAGYPDYKPENPAEGAAKNRLNPIIASVFEPGSIFKPFVIAAGLELKRVTSETVFNCENGAWKMPESRRVLHDAHGYGKLTVEKILVKSSNIGTAKVALEVGKKDLYKYLTGFGFGRKTGQPLIGEIDGTLRTPDKWSAYSMGSIPMGQEVTVTPLQVATAYCALANSGVLIKPRLVREVLDDDYNTVSAVDVQPLGRVISPKVAKEILLMLQKTVEEGTGKKAQLKKYTVGGKTGTAQLAVNADEIAAGHKGYSPNRYIGSFVGVAPIENPRLVVVVSIREPKTAHYGGTVAAPAVRRIIDDTLHYLKVEPSPADTKGGR